jgi:16S rRNA (cytosine967-C5)-methyltransferase
LTPKIDDEIKRMEEKYHFRGEIINRLCFKFGAVRAETLLQAVKKHPTSHALRVNQLETTRNELVKSFVKKDIPAKEHQSLEDAVLIAVKGPNEIKLLEKQITVHRKAGNRVITGTHLAVGGIRNQENIKIGDEVTLIDKYGTALANGVAMMTSQEMRRKKSGVAVKVTKSMYRLPNLHKLKEFLRGHFIDQTIPSMVIGSQIKLRANDRLLDMAVGEGEILTHIWQRNTKVKGTRIIALDESNSRLQRFNDTLERLRMANAPFEPMRLNVRGVRKRFSRDETFHWIIINPPSTNTALRPKIYETVSEGKIMGYSKLQKIFVKEAARLLKTKGTIFYTTNSLFPAENEEIIQYAVEELGLQVTKQELFLGENGLDVGFAGCDLLQRFYPDKQDTQGAFIAKLTKK